MARYPNKLSQFWLELKRRRVIKVTAMYAATAFIIMEAADIMLPRLGLPDWTVTFIIILLIAGFPITIILSWIFDVTEGGIKKTESMEDPEKPESTLPKVTGRRRIGNAVTIVLFMAVCVLVYPKIFKRDQLKNIRDEEGRISVAIMPFLNMTNDPSLDIWQVGVQNDLITRLSNSNELNVLGYETVHDILQIQDIGESAPISLKTIREISQKLDANTVIIGTILSSDNRIRLNVQMLNSATGKILKTYQVEGSMEEDIFVTLDTLSYLIKNYLEIKVLEQEAAFDYKEAYTESSDAYRHYIEGMKFLVNQKYDASLLPFTKALEIDSTFTMAMFYLALAHTFLETSSSNEVKYWLLKAYDRKSKLQLKYQYLLEQWYAVLISKNYEDIIKFLDLQENSGTDSRILLYDMGLTYNTIQDYKKACEVFEKVLKNSQRYGENWQNLDYYRAYAYSLCKMGECDKIEEIFELCQAIAPGQSDEIRMRQAICALRQGDSLDAAKYLGEFISHAQAEGKSAVDLILDLGDAYEEANCIEKSEAYYRNAYELEPQNTTVLFSLAHLLIVNEINVEEGLELIEDALKLKPERPSFIMVKGVGLFKQGQLDEAMKLLNISWEKRNVFIYEHYDYIQQNRQAISSRDN